MAVSDFSNLQSSVDFDDYDLTFGSYQGSSSTSYSWVTASGATVTLHGTDIAINTLSKPDAGLITSISVSYASGNPTAPDLVVSGFPTLNLATSSFSIDSGVAIYQLIAAGDSTLIGPTSNGGGLFFGDFGTISTLVTYGDDFDVTGTFGQSSAIAGGVFFLESGATLYGGTLTFDGAASLVMGDAFELYDESTLFGGDDSIILRNSTAAILGDSEMFVYGDVSLVAEGSTLHGGDDVIDARAVTDGSITRVIIRGDTYSVNGIDVGINRGTVFAGDDTIYGSATIDNYIIGDLDIIGFTAEFEAGNDTIYGGAGNDYLAGDVHDSSVFTPAGGDDVIYAGGGYDSIYGGDGNDTVFLQRGGGVVNGGDGDDLFVIQDISAHSIDGGSGNDTISFESSGAGIVASLLSFNSTTGAAGSNLDLSGIENINGSRVGNDTVYGRNGANEIFTFGGNDKVYAAGGGDIIELGDGNDQLYAEFGRDNSYNGGNGIDLISYQDAVAAVGVDIKLGRGISGNASGDTVTGFENLYGTKVGDDTLKGTHGDNTVKGFGGDDLIIGRRGDDRLFGAKGDDVIKGGSGADKLVGGKGNDLLKGGSGADIIKSGAGSDKVKGGSGDDNILGGGANDQLFGGSGDDTIKGGGGADTIYGNRGDDQLWGNSGSDIFVFKKGDDHDVILDFKDDVDTIRFTGLGSAGNPLGDASQVGNHVVFDFGNGDTLTVRNTTISALQDDVEWML